MPATRKQADKMDPARKRSESAEKLLEKALQDLERLLNVVPVDIAAVKHQMRVVDVKVKSFTETQVKYTDLLLEANQDDVFEQQEMILSDFRDRGARLYSQAEDTIKPATAVPAGIPVPVVPAPAYHPNLPKRVLESFGGDVRQWKSFWASFGEVDRNADIPELEKYNLLKQQMISGSTAEKVVKSFPADPASYQLAKKELEERFGREATLIKVCVRDLLELMEAAKSKKQNFVDVATSLQAQILYLEQLGVTQDKYGLLLYPIIESSIPVDVLNRYLESPGCREELADILDFLKREVRRREETARAQDAFAKKEDLSMKGPSKRSEASAVPTAINFANVDRPDGCGFCGRPGHSATECRTAVNWTPEKRKEELRKSGHCFRCLKPGHNAKKCKAKLNCANCRGNHHVLSCRGETDQRQGHGQFQRRVDNVNLAHHQTYQRWEQPSNRTSENQPLQQYSPANLNYGPGPSYVPVAQLGQQRSASSNTVTNRTDGYNYVRKPEVLLQTLMIRVYSPCRTAWKVVRAMIDPGSQSSYVTISLLQELQGTIIGKEKVVHQLFGGTLTKELVHEVSSIVVSGVNQPYLSSVQLNASVMDKIAQNVTAVPQGPWIEECRQNQIPLTDLGNQGDIEVMIGNDVSPYIKLDCGSIPLKSGLVATETKLGWVLEGNLPKTSTASSSKAMMCVNMYLSEKEVESYWALETIGIKDAEENRSRAELEEAAVLHFNETVERTEDGRYKVHLPFIEGHPSIPENRGLAYRRLEKTTQDLSRDGYLEKYHQIFQDWETQGIIEKVDSKVKPTGIVHYLGHRAVYKEGSTTPVRPVFNASGRTKNSPALNDCLENGPNLLELIPSILSRFRMDEYGVLSDVEKAFLQLLVTETHRDCLRFLWWEDPMNKKTVVEYRHCRVVFGVNSSPFLLAVVIEHLLQEWESKYPETVSKLRASMYVDNCVASVKSEEAVVKFREEAMEIFASAKMNLRGWECGPSSDTKTVPVLGMLWNTGTDMLTYDIAKMMKDCADLPATRRNVLKLANSLFDKLGLVSPVVIVIKILFKRICADERNFGWDTELPEEYAKEFRRWRKEVKDLQQLSIPRRVTPTSGDRTNWSLHVMCDSSKEAYACCVFLRVEGNPVHLQLLQSRARVTPKKPITIPRSELVSCLIASRLCKRVIKDLNLQDIPVTYWNDSSVAIAWMRRMDQVWGVFVNRRVEEIRRLTKVGDWKHITGELNPADLPSRGTTVEKFLKVRWWEGPEWLRGPTENFPVSMPAPDEEVLAERKKTVVSAVNVVNAPQALDKLERFSSWTRAVKCVAYLYRLFKYLKSKELKKGPLSAEEYEIAEVKLLRFIQERSLEMVSAGLQLLRGQDGLLRVKTRIVELEDEASFRYPIVLDGNDPLVRLLIAKVHWKSAHAQDRNLKTLLREKFWIVGGPRNIKKVIKNCVVCRVHNAKKCEVIEAPLPLDRIKMVRCFEVCGVDLAGPLVLKDGSKAWIVLFTCAVYRAVHLEVVSSLSTDAFIVALRKFVARRGRPKTIYSDNGTNFAGCNNKFAKLNWKKVEEYAAVKSIKWIFSVATAKWWGGFWERLIGLMKQLLRRVLGKQAVYLRELELLVIEVEAVMNERPLTVVTENPNDLQPLTPASFMRDLPVPWIPEADVCDAIQESHRHIQRLREELRSRFRKEYLAELVHRGKTMKSDELQCDDVVLVEVEGKKRLEWPIGYIVGLIPGRGRVERCARIRTATGEMVRPLQRLYPLELQRGIAEGETSLKEPTQETTPEVITPAEAEEPYVTRAGRIVNKPSFM